MHYIPLLFLCAKVFSFIYHRELALFLHNFRAIVEARRSTKKVHVVFIDKTTIFYAGDCLLRGKQSLTFKTITQTNLKIYKNIVLSPVHICLHHLFYKNSEKCPQLSAFFIEI